MARCKLIRNKNASSQYQLFLECENNNRFVMAAKKIGLDGYLLTASLFDHEKNSNNYLGKVKKPIGKSIYTLYSFGKNPKKFAEWKKEKWSGDVYGTYDRSFREEMALIELGKDRDNLVRISLHIPKLMPVPGLNAKEDGAAASTAAGEGDGDGDGCGGDFKRRAIHPVHPNSGIEYLKNLKKNLTASSSFFSSSSSFYSSPSEMESLIQLTNRKTIFSKKTGQYTLNLHNRGRVSSVKNMQIVAGTVPDVSEEQAPTILQFGKMDDTTFCLDFTHPFCPLQAFAVAMSLFDY